MLPVPQICQRLELQPGTPASRQKQRKKQKTTERKTVKEEKNKKKTKITQRRQDGADRKVRCTWGGTYDKLNYFKGD